MNTEMSLTREAEIRLVADSARDFVQGKGGLGRARKMRFTPNGFDREVWGELCEMGWLGLLLPEATGGSELGTQEYLCVAQAAGEALLPEPLIGGVLAARMLEGEPLADALAGRRVILPAWQEAPCSLDAGGRTHAAGGRVTGRKLWIHQARGADAFVVSTAEACYLVDRHGPGVSLVLHTTQDGGHFGDLTLVDAPGMALSGHIQEHLDEAALAESAFLLGVAQGAFAMTLEYLGSRHQFGKPIGSFQALQHRVADLKIQLALAEACAQAAAVTLDETPDPVVRAAAASRAKARCADTALLVTRQALQLHGAIGYSDEYDVGLYLRSAMTHAGMCGSAAVHRARYAAHALGKERVQ